MEVKYNSPSLYALISKLKKFLYLSKYSIKYKFTLAVVFIVLVPMSLSYFYAYTSTYKALKINGEELLLNSLHIIGDQLESQFDIINQTSMLFLSNATIRSTLYIDDEETKFLQTEKKIRIDRELKNLLLFNYAWDRKLLKSVFIFESSGQYYFISRNSINTDIYHRNFDINKFILLPNTEKFFIPPTENDKTIYFTRNIKDLNTQSLIGLLVLAIDVNALTQFDNSLVAYSDVQIITFDDDGTIFSHTDKSKLGQKIDPSILSLDKTSEIQEITIDDQSYLVAAMKLNDYNLNSIIAIPKNEVFSNLNKDMRGYLLTISISMIFAVLLGLYLSTRAIAPLNLLASISEKIKGGNFHSKLPPSKYVELNQLNIVFNSMIDEIDYLINQVYEKQLLLKESELSMLQTQINPHFFFNLLETIGWEAKFSNSERIYEMVKSLGELMRSCINLSSNEKITIGEELQYIKHYLSLQKIRFEDRISTEINVLDPAINHFYIPKLCILPIVENAIVHGLERKMGKGHLNISIYLRDQTVMFEIIDDGLGFIPERFNFNQLESIEMRKNNHRSIGLYNSNKRIKLMYGESYGILVESEINKGTKVTLLIPIDRGESRNVFNNDCR